MFNVMFKVSTIVANGIILQVYQPDSHNDDIRAASFCYQHVPAGLLP